MEVAGFSKTSAPTYLLNFCLGIPKFLTKLEAVLLLQAFCHLEWNEKAKNTCYTTLLSGSDKTHPAVLRASKKSRMCMKVPSTTTLKFPHPFAITYCGKNYSWILFGQTSYFVNCWLCCVFRNVKLPLRNSKIGIILFIQTWSSVPDDPGIFCFWDYTLGFWFQSTSDEIRSC
jgi:hypothetical protein